MVDQRTFVAAVAERAGLSKEEAADLTRATLEAIAGQISSGEVQKLAQTLPDWLVANLPAHDGSAHPMAVTQFVTQISGRTGLKEEEVRRGAGAVLAVLREAIDRTHLDHALAQLPQDYRELEAV
jgi:uncharacterized protein (DUF2267 family)